MNVLLSIKPKYVEEIKKGSKKYEFRKSFTSKKNMGQIEKIFIYCSSPVKKIVARFYFNEIIEDNPRSLWNKFSEYSGIDEKDFFKYFGIKEKGYAIKITKIKFYDDPIEPKSIMPDFTPPQSFCYIEDIESQCNLGQFM